ncbi:efflux RND transporter periplasmic adaptor subunit [Muricoccus radiodurans]|uniref:efflux RND transporter periplasmic adaptor subunit n=1 Tax=Muricoccus radiodurans TaxID=2231721 RepID=UPI003CF148E9
MFGLSALAALAVGGCDENANAQQARAAPANPTVTVVSLSPEPVTVRTVLPGRTAAFRTAEIRPQVSGVLRQRLFREGEQVAENQPLFQIDAAPYQAALASAEASLAKAQASLESARSTATRYRPLVAQNAVSRLDYDTAVAAQRAAEADVASGRAAVETARINLGYTRVNSPIAGRTGRSSVTVGALVTADQATALLTVTQLDPIHVDVTQPAAAVLRLRRELEAGRLRRDPDNAAEVHLLLEDGTEYPLAGRLQFSEVTVNTETNTVTLRAEFPNPQGTLMPGMFVRARLEQGEAQSALLVPQQGVTRNPRGQPIALVVQSDGTVATRVLEVGQAVGNKWLVQGGLQAGDRVIVEGTQRVRNGATPELRQMTADAFDRQVAEEATAARQVRGG